ncbi:MAG: polyhydroxybutyrate depolymerase, partial [Pseudomonadota bacterium]
LRCLMRSFLIALLLLISASPAMSCGGVDDACETSLGSYFAATPEGDGPHPLMIFFHGGGGWGDRVLKLRKKMTAEFTEAGWIVLGPNGLKRPGSRFGPGWSFISQFEPLRDEAAFAREMIEDARQRFGADPSRVMIAGYSIGGSLTSKLACDDPKLAFAFAPVAGGFWRPHPTDCAGPVRLLHTHGWRDQTVPLEGRPLSFPGVEQGDIYETLARWREENGCAKYRADKFVTDGPFWRRIWTHCEAGALEFALHPSGHKVPAEWPALAMSWFASLEAE